MRELYLSPKIAAMLTLLVYEYNLPLMLTLGETVVIPANGRRHRSILKKVTVAFEELNEEILDAALLILNVNE